MFLGIVNAIIGGTNDAGPSTEGMRCDLDASYIPFSLSYA